MFRYILSLIIIASITSCTAVKLSVPQQFTNEATKMHVKGLQGWKINQKISFGSYQTSSIKRGWDLTSSFQHTKFNISPEEMILRVFNIETDKNRMNQKGKFQYTIADGQLAADIFATEKFSERELIYKSNNPYIGTFSKTNKYEYAFTAAILPLIAKESKPWSLVLINKYDVKNDTARKLFDRPYVEEEGYATNGTDNITIRPLRIDKVTTKSGKDTKVFGGKMLSGYELQWDGGVVAIIDLLDSNIWFANNLDAKDRIVLSAISSAILLKRMQDVEKDRDEI
jgi:hypothetical protein